MFHTYHPYPGVTQQPPASIQRQQQQQQASMPIPAPQQPLPQTSGQPIGAPHQQFNADFGTALSQYSGGPMYAGAYQPIVGAQGAAAGQPNYYGQGAVFDPFGAAVYHHQQLGYGNYGSAPAAAGVGHQQQGTAAVQQKPPVTLTGNYSNISDLIKELERLSPAFAVRADTAKKDPSAWHPSVIDALDQILSMAIPAQSPVFIAAKALSAWVLSEQGWLVDAKDAVAAAAASSSLTAPFQQLAEGTLLAKQQMNKTDAISKLQAFISSSDSYASVLELERSRANRWLEKLGALKTSAVLPRRAVLPAPELPSFGQATAPAVKQEAPKVDADDDEDDHAVVVAKPAAVVTKPAAVTPTTIKTTSSSTSSSATSTTGHYVRKPLYTPPTHSVTRPSSSLSPASSSTTRSVSPSRSPSSVTTPTKPAADKEPAQPKVSAMEELFQLVGLSKVKSLISDMKANIELEQRMRKANPQYKGNDMALNMLFLGNPGTGKTTVARIVAKALQEIGFIQKGKTPDSGYFETTGAQLARMDNGERMQFFEKAKGGVLFIDEAYQLDPKTNAGGADAMNDLLLIAEDWRKDTVIILAGYREDIQKLIEYNSGLTSRFPQEISFDDYGEDELYQILVSMLRSKNHKVEDEKMLRVVARRLAAASGSRGFGNARTVRVFVESCIIQKNKRIATLKEAGTSISDEELFVLSKEDMLGFDELPSNSRVLEELDSMVGLDEVKRSIRGLLQLVKTNHLRETEGMKPQNISLHRVFLGNPGTGKTTVAKLYARMLKELGLISKGDLMVVKPADFIGAVVGESEKKTKAILEAARGKVLFVDEAYGLYSSASASLGSGGTSAPSDPFRAAVIDTLVAEVQGTPGEDIALLMAGYRKEMLSMLQNANPGLARRMQIESAFNFEDYTDEQLEVILCKSVYDAGLKIRRTEAKRVIRERISRLRCKPNFGNAGEINNALNIAKQRLAMEPQMNDELCAEHFLPQEDLPGASSAKDALDKLVGLYDLKNTLFEMRALIDVAKEDGKDPAQKIASAMNFLFVGPPGTGKTTAARLMGRVLREYGVLPYDKVVEKSATEMQTGFVGQAGAKTRSVLDEALGSVLFIDEAYRLLPSNGSFNREIVDELVQALTEDKYRGKLAVILAGYEQDIAVLIRSNPGLESRFPSKVNFTNMKPEDAARMFLSICQSEQAKLGDDLTQPGLATLFTKVIAETANWSNGRDVNTLFQMAERNRAVRISKSMQQQQQQDRRFLLVDVQEACQELMQSRAATQKFADLAANKKSSYDDNQGGGAFQSANSNPLPVNIATRTDVDTAKATVTNTGASASNAGDNSPIGNADSIMTHLETVCTDMQIDLDQLVDSIQRSGGDPPAGVVERIAQQTSAPAPQVALAIRNKQQELTQKLKEMQKRRAEIHEQARQRKTESVQAEAICGFCGRLGCRVGFNAKP